jgi:hypothetical protein
MLDTLALVQISSDFSSPSPPPPAKYYFTILYIHHHINVALVRRTSGRTLEHSNKELLFWISGSSEQNSASSLCWVKGFVSRLVSSSHVRNGGL